MEETTQTTNNVAAKVERFERNLRVALTDKEIADRANRAAHIIAERDQKDEEREAANKHAKAQIAELEAELRKVSTEVRDRATYRAVSCERAYLFRVGNVTEHRLDTGEQLSERAMSDYERQLEMPLDDIEEMQRKSAAGESDPPELGTTKKPKRGRRKNGQAVA